MKKSKQIKVLTKKLVESDKRALSWEGRAHQANRRADQSETLARASRELYVGTRAELNRIRHLVRTFSTEVGPADPVTDTAAQGTLPQGLGFPFGTRLGVNDVRSS